MFSGAESWKQIRSSRSIMLHGGLDQIRRHSRLLSQADDGALKPILKNAGAASALPDLLPGTVCWIRLSLRGTALGLYSIYAISMTVVCSDATKNRIIRESTVANFIFNRKSSQPPSTRISVPDSPRKVRRRRNRIEMKGEGDMKRITEGKRKGE